MARRPPVQSDWPAINEFARRRDRFAKTVAISTLGTIFAIFVGLPLTALGLALLMPLCAALTHLRCPLCDTATTLCGVTDGQVCLRCHRRLRF